MSPITTTALLFWASTLSVIALITFDAEYRRGLGSHRPALTVVLVLLLIWRVPLDGHFFYGLEYEDAYIYSVVGRAMAMGIDGPPDASFLTSVCSTGSLLDCSAYEMFASHYIGSAYLFSVANRIWGFAVVNANIVGLASNVLSALALWYLAWRIANTSTAIAATLVLSATPAFATFGVAAFAEPTANAFATMALAIGVRLLLGSEKERLAPLTLSANVIALTAVMSMAVLIKRESAVVCISLSLVAVVASIHASRRQAAGRLQVTPWIALSGLCVCVLALHAGFAQTLTSETGEFGQYPFAFKTLAQLLPLFLVSAVRWHWYLAGAIPAVIGIISLCRRPNAGATAVLLSGLGFLLLYASHVRSHYMLVYGEVSEFDTLRYSITLMSGWSLVAGVGIEKLYRIVRPRQLRAQAFYRHAIVALFLLVAGVSYLFTARLRAAVVDDEYWGRVRPAQTAVTEIALRPNAYIISLESLLLQLHGPPTTRIVDFAMLSQGSLSELLRRDPDATLWYLSLDVYESEADRLRYREQFAEVASFNKEIVLTGEGFTIYALMPYTAAASLR